VRIKNPAAVAELFELTLTAAEENRRLIFYCACEFPRLDGVLACHRLTITELLLAHAKKVAQTLAVVEWPGGEPVETRLKFDSKLVAMVMRGGRKSIPFMSEHLEEFAGLPWASPVAIECEDGVEGYVLAGRAKFAKSKTEGGFWYLRVIQSLNPRATKEARLCQALRWRAEHGLDEQVSR
jgi:hypothetical protein